MCEYAIAGIGRVFLDRAVSTEHGCVVDEEEVEYKEDSEHVYVWDRIRTPLQLHAYTPQHKGGDDKQIDKPVVSRKTMKLVKG